MLGDLLLVFYWQVSRAREAKFLCKPRISVFNIAASPAALLLSTCVIVKRMAVLVISAGIERLAILGEQRTV